MNLNSLPSSKHCFTASEDMSSVTIAKASKAAKRLSMTFSVKNLGSFVSSAVPSRSKDAPMSSGVITVPDAALPLSAAVMGRKPEVCITGWLPTRS